MDIGPQQAPIVIEPVEDPVPAGPPPVADRPGRVPDEEPVPA